MFEKEYKVPSLEAPSSRGGRWTVGLYCVTSYIPVDLSLSTIFFFWFYIVLGCMFCGMSVSKHYTILLGMLFPFV